MTGRKGTLFALTVMLIFVFSILSVTYADNLVQTLKGYTGVRIIYNNQELIDERQPYIINDSVYVPVRMLMENFDKSINYEPSTNRVIIKDRVDTTGSAQINELNSTISSLRGQIAKLQSENAALTSKNDSLTAENKTLTTKISTLNNRVSALNDVDDELNDIENEIQDDFDDAGDDYLNDNDAIVSISVSGDEDDVELEVFLDLSDADHNEMTDYSYTNVKNLLKAIYDDLEKELNRSDDYDKADIDSSIEDEEGNELEYNGSTFDPISW